MAKAAAATGRNRLASEASPYLQQHAANPVDWWPWGEAAFAEARRRDVPLFVSIGYATCHWCHVMAHESFEDADVARLMNEAFVNVKVDREERPDVDDACMAVCQAMTGSGGWPLTVFMSPDKKPFLAGTYFPKTTRFGRMGMVDLVPKVAEAWRDQRSDLMAQAQHLLDHVGAGSHRAGELPHDALDKAEANLAARFDAAHGGFGGAPKFPSPHTLLFLLRRHARTKDPKSLAMVVQTLDAMAAGGIRDHLGGGFHRYSTDRHWLLPHFEKMLYDQAMLAMAFTEAFHATGEQHHAALAREILDYVLRDLKDPGGGFRCAEDADSEGVEGKFYVWSRDELDATLGRDDADLVAAAYGVAREGNVHDEATHKLTGANVLHLPRPLATVAKAKGLTVDELERRLAASRASLLAVRARRVRPLLDDKVLTDWNGLAIAAFAKAGAVLGEPRYVEAAVEAARFLQREMVIPGRPGHASRLRHRFKAGVKDDLAFLDDHAFLLWGLVELHDATLDAAWLAWALDVAGGLARFRDPAGGWFLAPDDGEDLGVRRKEAYDGALPSGNAVAAWSLVRLALLTGDERWEAEAAASVGAFAGLAAEHPQAFTGLLLAHDLAQGSRELLVAGSGRPALDLLAEARRRYDPHLVLLHQSAALAKVAPWTKDHVAPAGKAAAFLCEGHACKRPVTTVAELSKLLD